MREKLLDFITVGLSWSLWIFIQTGIASESVKAGTRSALDILMAVNRLESEQLRSEKFVDAFVKSFYDFKTGMFRGYLLASTLRWILRNRSSNERKSSFKWWRLRKRI